MAHKTTTISGGYTLIPVTCIANILAFSKQKKTHFFLLRVFFALLEMRHARQGLLNPHYSEEEIQQLLGNGSRERIKEALSKLKAVGLLREFSRTSIEINFDTALSSEAEDICSLLTQNGNPKRLVPMPRRWLKVMMKHSLPAITRVMLVLVVWGMWMKRGVISSSGRITDRFIAQVTSCSASTVYNAKLLLWSCGFITRDTQSTWFTMRRYGWWFEICVENLQPFEAKLPHDFEGIEAKSPHDFDGSIYKPKPSPKENKHQTPSSSGVCTANGASMLNVRREDLTNRERLQCLFQDALKRGIVAPTTQLLDFVAAAVRGVYIEAAGKGNAVKIFVTIVRKQLWHYISNAQEDKARRLMREDDTEPAKQKAVKRVVVVKQPVRPQQPPPLDKQSNTHLIETLQNWRKFRLDPNTFPGGKEAWDRAIQLEADDLQQQQQQQTHSPEGETDNSEKGLLSPVPLGTGNRALLV